MSKFITKKISSEYIWIVDLWTYKIRVWICKYNLNSIYLLWFTERRQSIEKISGDEIVNLEHLCENIHLTIKKAEQEAKVKIDNIVLNPSFSDIFFINKKLSYIRKNKEKIINETEIDNIITNLEEIWIKEAWNIIKDRYLYNLSDLDIITTNISSIKIDNTKKSWLLWETWKIINLNLLNIFIPKSSSEIIAYIGSYLDKKIIKILSEDFSIAKIWEQTKDIVIINIWNLSSFITIRDEEWNIIWSNKIWIWLNDLIKKISINTNLSDKQIIKNLDNNNYFQKEKEEFLEIYFFILLEIIKEIVQDNICPNNFFIVWWWGNNNFFKDYFKKIDFSKHSIKINPNIKFLIPDVKKIWKIENVEEILNKSNLNIISMILTYFNIKNNKIDIIEKSLEKAVKKILM